MPSVNRRNHFSSPSRRSFGCCCLSGVLALWVLLLSFAGASPALHDWLHGETACGTESEHPAPVDHGAESHEEGGHFCGVTSLHTGALCCAPVALPEWTSFVVAELPREPETPRNANFPLCFQARAPPIEIVV